MQTSPRNRALNALLSATLGPISDSIPAQVLAGDASTRRYVRLGPFAGGQTFILMEMGPSGGCEEKGSLPSPSGALPFVEIQHLFKGWSIPVPTIHGYDPTNRLMLLEDLGDETLAARVEAAGIEGAAPYYKAACIHLARLQGRGQPEGVLGIRNFDAPLFLWEFEHFQEFGIDAEYGALPTEALSQAYALFRSLSEELAALPQVVVHRDYHARNLMVHGADIHMIDFQDALMGPGAYDLVSLLQDAYVKVPEKLQSELIAVFQQTLKEEGARALPTQAFKRAFDLCGFHRSLKAAGRFAFFKHTRGNDAYMSAVPAALENAKRAASSHPDLRDLCAILSVKEPRLAL